LQVVGSAIAISLLTYNRVPLWAGVLLTAVASFLLLLLEQFGVRFLEALFAALIGTMAAAFGVMYVLAGVPTPAVVEGALISSPHLTGFECTDSCLRLADR
jgi:natural resistance-associated macrophage protein